MRLEDFINKEYINKALRHSSKNYIHNYEKLEFLGDAILLNELNKLLLFKNISKKEINNYQQYYLCESHLAYCAKKLNLTPNMNLSNANYNISDRLYSNIIESIIASIYLYGKNIDKFCKHFIFYDIDNIKLKTQSSKIELQNLCMIKKINRPIYISYQNKNIFISYVILILKKTENYYLIHITHESSDKKKEAEKLAASQMLNELLNKDL